MSYSPAQLLVVHAVLAALHPRLLAAYALPLPLPTELHALVCVHLHTALTRDLAQALQNRLRDALDALCDECKAYHAHVYGPSVVDWPCIQHRTGCCCASVGRGAQPSPSVSPPASATAGCDVSHDRDRDRGFSLVSPTAPPAYMLGYMRDTLAAYTAVAPCSSPPPSIDALLASVDELVRSHPQPSSLAQVQQRILGVPVDPAASCLALADLRAITYEPVRPHPGRTRDRPFAFRTLLLVSGFFATLASAWHVARIVLR